MGSWQAAQHIHLSQGNRNDQQDYDGHWILNVVQQQHKGKDLEHIEVVLRLQIWMEHK